VLLMVLTLQACRGSSAADTAPALCQPRAGWQSRAPAPHAWCLTACLSAALRPHPACPATSLCVSARGIRTPPCSWNAACAHAALQTWRPRSPLERPGFVCARTGGVHACYKPTTCCKGARKELQRLRAAAQALLDEGLLTREELERAIATRVGASRVSFHGGDELWVQGVLDLGVDPRRAPWL